MIRQKVRIPWFLNLHTDTKRRVYEHMPDNWRKHFAVIERPNSPAMMQSKTGRFHKQKEYRHEQDHFRCRRRYHRPF